MEKKHQELADQLAKAQALAVEIEQAGGNVQAVIHHLRSASTLVKLRLENYAEANAKAEAEAKPKK